MVYTMMVFQARRNLALYNEMVGFDVIAALSVRASYERYNLFACSYATVSFFAIIYRRRLPL